MYEFYNEFDFNLNTSTRDMQIYKSSKWRPIFETKYLKNFISYCKIDNVSKKQGKPIKSFGSILFPFAILCHNNTNNNN